MTLAGNAVEAEVEATNDPKKRRKNKRPSINPGESRLAFTLIAPTVIVLALIVGFPIIKAIYQSFLTDPGLDKVTGFFNAGNKWNGIGNYKYWLLEQCPKPGGGSESCPAGTLGSQTWQSVYVTVLFTVIEVAIDTVIGVGFALMMNRKFRGRALVRAAILVPWAIPTAVTAKLWYIIFDPQGIANALFGLHTQWFSSVWPARSAIMIADIWKTAPFIALLVLAGLQGISEDLYESAKIDGATAWQRFTKITLPLIKPALGVAIVFRSLDVLRMYDLVAIMTGGANGTTTLSLLVSKQLLATNLNSASALSTFTFLLIFAIAFVLVRLFHANITGQKAR